MVVIYDSNFIVRLNSFVSLTTYLACVLCLVVNSCFFSTLAIIITIALYLSATVKVEHHLDKLNKP